MRLTAFFKKLRLRQVLTVFLAGVLLIVSTACSGATTQGANPGNPPVQIGGNNNPYKSGGDGSADLKMSPNSKMNDGKAKSGRDQANLQLKSARLTAAADESGLLYPGAETPEGRAKKEAGFPIITNESFTPKAGGFNQRNPDAGQKLETRVETAKEAFKEASSFVKDKADEAGQRPELKSNPALNK